MSDFEVVRGYLHDGDGKQYPDGVEALSRIEAELARLRDEQADVASIYRRCCTKEASCEHQRARARNALKETQ